MKFLTIRLLKLKYLKSFFRIEAIDGYQNLEEEFRTSNKLMIQMGFVEEDKLKVYYYNS